MILVDVQVLMLDQVYDFELDEEMDVEEVMEDMIALITKEEHCTCKNIKDMSLYTIRRECVLEESKSLKSQGVTAGDRLILF